MSSVLASRPRPSATVALVLILLLPALSALPGSVVASTCDVDEARDLPAGTIAPVAGVSEITLAIPAECVGSPYSLEGANRSDDFDICWDGASGEIRCDAASGDERGTIPDGTVEARVQYWAGVAGGFHLRAGFSIDPVSDPVDLYFHSALSGSGNVDWGFGATTMDEDAPTGSHPAVWHSIYFFDDSIPQSPFDAHWTWEPIGGYDYVDAAVTLRFWASTVGDAALLGNTWDVSVYNEDQLVASTGPDGYVSEPVLPVPTEFVVELGPVSFTGGSLTVKIDPRWVDSDAINIILYDSVSYPSRLEVRPAGPDVTPPGPVSSLAANALAADFVDVEWAPALDDVAVSHYEVHRVTVGRPPILLGTKDQVGTDFNHFGDDTTVAETTYTYSVRAVDTSGNVGPFSEVTVTTPDADVTPPTLEWLTITPGATVANVAFELDGHASGDFLFGTAEPFQPGFSYSTDGVVEEAMEGLRPNTTYSYRLTAEDASGNLAEFTGSFATSADQTFYLHNVGPEFVQSMNEFDTAGDNDGRGYNLLGSAVASAEGASGLPTPLLGPLVDDFPAADPTNPAVRLRTGEAIQATIYVSASLAPPVTGTVAQETVGTVALRLSLFAQDGTPVGTQVVSHDMVGDVDWIPYEFSFLPAIMDIDRGTLVARLSADLATTAWYYGYEGDHASRITLPIAPVLPLAVEATIDAVGAVMEDDGVTFTANAVGGLAPYSYAWAFDDATTTVGQSVFRNLTDPGRSLATVTATDANGQTASAVISVRVQQRDFTDEARVVVAVVDSGINPYHDLFQRPGIDMPLSEFVDATTGDAPRTIALSSGPDYLANVAADEALWAGIGEGELVWFEGTNVLGVTMGNSGTPILDDPDDGHGSATSSTVLQAWPDALIVMVENDNLLLSSGIPRAFAWATAQPWIDVVSASLGNNGNAPEPFFLYQAPAIQRQAWLTGKLWVNSAGNDPSPILTDGLDGSPWAISVAGSQAGGRGREVMSSTVYPDVASNFTVFGVADHQSTDGGIRISGTSFSAPTVAGTLAGAIHEARRAALYTGGISGGDLIPSTGLDNAFVRAAMNKTAVYTPTDGYVAGINSSGDVGVPVAPWAAFGWGHVDASIIPDLLNVIASGDLGLPPPPTDKGMAAVYMGVQHESRRAYWNPFVVDFFG